MQTIEARLAALEARVKKLEGEPTPTLNSSDRELMEELYKKAKDLVQKNQIASVGFLQKKLWVDYPRAKQILERLEAEGVVGPSTGFGLRPVLSK